VCGTPGKEREHSCDGGKWGEGVQRAVESWSVGSGAKGGRRRMTRERRGGWRR